VKGAAASPAAERAGTSSPMHIIAIVSGITAAVIVGALLVMRKVRSNAHAKNCSSEDNETDADLTTSGPDAGMSLGKGEFTNAHRFKGGEIDV